MLEKVVKKETILEECAKEAAELSSACLSASLSMRGDDIYFKADDRVILADLSDKVANIYVILNELTKAGLIDDNDIYTLKKHKTKALYGRVGA